MFSVFGVAAVPILLSLISLFLHSHTSRAIEKDDNLVRIRLEPMSADELRKEASETDFLEAESAAKGKRKKMEERKWGKSEGLETKESGSSEEEEETVRSEGGEKEEDGREMDTVPVVGLEEDDVGGKSAGEAKKTRPVERGKKAPEDRRPEEAKWVSGESHETAPTTNGTVLAMMNSDGGTAPEGVDTAPPDVAKPELSVEEEDGKPELSEDFLRRLSEQQVANERARLHRGGNLRKPVDFDEALRVTVPSWTEEN